MGAKNVLGLISLGLTRGQSVEIEVDGPHEERIADEMQALFEREFDFQR